MFRYHLEGTCASKGREYAPNWPDGEAWKYMNWGWDGAKAESLPLKIQFRKLDSSGQPDGGWLDDTQDLGQVDHWAQTAGSCAYPNEAWSSSTHYHGKIDLTAWATPGIELRFRHLASGIDYLTASTVALPQRPAAPGGLAVTSTSPPGQTLTYDMVAALAIKSGWPTRELQIEATAVARAESSFRTKAVSYIGCCHGLWQVNSSVHNTTADEMFDPYKNGLKAYSIYKASGSWQPWEAYTNGAYQAYMANAEAAVDRQRSNNADAYASIPSAPVDSNGSVSLAWAKPTTGCESGCTYKLQRSTDQQTWTNVASGFSTLYRTDTNAVAGTTYYYRVIATNAEGESEASTPVSVVVGAAQPSAGCESLCGSGANDPSAGETEGGGGVSCSGFNVFCWIKAALRWAFVPGESTKNAWATFKSNLQTRPPFSAVIGALAFINGWIDGVLYNFNNDAAGTGAGHMCLNFQPLVPDAFPNETNVDLDTNGTQSGTHCMGDTFLRMAESSALVGTIRTVIGFLVAWGVSLAIWRILRSGFGMQPEARGVDPIAGDDDGDG